MSISPIGSLNLAVRISGIVGINTVSQASKSNKSEASGECQTCKERQYRCGNGTPENVDPRTSFSQVMTHERNHLAEQQLEAEQKGMKITSTNIKIEYTRCPECGRMYASGGEAVSNMTSKSSTPNFLNNLGSQIDLKA